MTESGHIEIYQTEDGQTRIEVRLEQDTLWLSQAQLAELFDRDVRTVNEHIRNVFADGELDREATTRKFRIVRQEGAREVAREIEEILRLGDERASEIDLFDDDYLAKIEKIKLPNSRIKLLQQLLAKAIGDFRKTNRARGIDFSRRFAALVDKYNERDEDSVLVSGVLDEFSERMVELIMEMREEHGSHDDLGIDLEEKAFYDILFSLARKYDFQYADDKLIALARAVKALVDDKARYTDWDRREDIKAELKVDLILLLAEHGYPPVDRDEVYQEIFEQAENFKKHRAR